MYFGGEVPPSIISGIFTHQKTRTFQYKQNDWPSLNSKNDPVDIAFQPLDITIFTTNNTSEDDPESFDSQLNFLDINITAEFWREGYDSNLTCYHSACVANNDTLNPNIVGLPPDGRNWPFLFLTALVVAGGLGNVLVCLAICLEKRLQNVTNYFLLSLAVADLLVCVAVMPFGILDGFLGYWPFDWPICSVWVTCDVLSCSSSIMHMCFISLGRYLGIRNPLKTRSSSKKIVMMKIVLVWLVSMAITSPITVLAMIDPTNIIPTRGLCAINNRFFFMFGSMFAFYVPMVIMVVTYVLTVRLLQRKAKFLAEKPTRRVPFIRRGRRSSPSSPSDSTTKNGNIQQTTLSTCQHCGRCQANDAICGDTKGLLSPQSRPSSSQGFVRVRIGGQSGHGQHNRTSTQHQQQLVPGMVRTLGTNQVANEQKATKVLGIVFFCFVVCWTPFFILNVLLVFMDPEEFHPYLATTFQWLGYVSSTINPIIYTVFNKTFKRAFWKLLTCKFPFARHVSLNSNNDLSTWAFRSANYTTKSGSPPDPYQDTTMC
ncbi:5-hydroxytryptamine receptor 2C [Parasteatoda tepidariorum]|uniref:5-hydroxytryptamine receptor 2C n=1 Tax=Parasteatoda tepidariorum TaxID=114398 RepID=UPI00077F82C5|nr:5-hydroxytryptamine receptor 2C [Parasteatoda tepidariorum]